VLTNGILNDLNHAFNELQDFLHIWEADLELNRRLFDFGLFAFYNLVPERVAVVLLDDSVRYLYNSERMAYHFTDSCGERMCIRPLILQDRTQRTSEKREGIISKAQIP